jgi:hypothetical protein
VPITVDPRSSLGVQLNQAAPPSSLFTVAATIRTIMPVLFTTTPSLLSGASALHLFWRRPQTQPATLISLLLCSEEKQTRRNREESGKKN